jgi:hypothetical protein
MAETWDPIVEIAITGIGFDGEDWGEKRGEGSLRVSPEVIPENRALIEALRAVAVKRLDAMLLSLMLTRQELAFDVPNQPLDDDVYPLVGLSESVNEVARVLHALAPTRYDEDEGDDDSAPEEPPPDPVAAQEPREGGTG